MRFLLFAVLFVSVAHAEEKAVTLSREFTVKTVSVDMQNINDVGLIFVSHEDASLVLVGQVSWGLGITGLAGKGEFDLLPFMEEGNNFVLFVLWNKQGKTIDTKFYKSTLMEKWSYEFSIYGDGTNLFRQKDQGSAGVGIVHYFVFNVDKHGNNYAISAADSEQLSKAAYKLNKLNSDLQTKKIPEGNADIASMLSVALTGG